MPMTIDYAVAQDWVLRIGGAIIILIVAHFAAKAVKWTIAKGVDRLPFFARRDGASPSTAKPMVDVGERVGEVGYWLVWLLGFMAALTVLRLEAVVTPLYDMVRGFLNYLPAVVGAALIFFIGFVLATIVRRMVEAAVEAMELDRRLVDAGLTHTPRGPGLARLLGILTFTLIIIPVAIAALDILDISAISDPATAMLNNILMTIPRVIGAALIIFIAYVIGRWVMTLTEEGLKSIGFDDIINSIANAEPVRVGRERMDLTPGVDTARFSAFPPSRMIGLAVLIGIVLFAAVEAARMLEFGAMAAMLAEVLTLATRVLFGAVIIALGILLANILAAASAKEGKPSSEIISTLVRWGVIALATAVGLRFMGLANDIIVLAFGLILGSVAVAVAIAFGIGGRDAAKKLLDRWSGR
ncbi:mechanosensitive ion channel [Vitreimonas flagellata]|uniref:mechanosensitive ion channel n=1 Tax=Vitreimonas flagellata TaxID=2560861 RepID=UPI001075893A|nr:mechanosensitive ion channel [Vitreimonas flagellata]